MWFFAVLHDTFFQIAIEFFLRLDTRTRPVRLAAIRTQAVRYPHPKNHN
jgi:hypothetical protein